MSPRAWVILIVVGMVMFVAFNNIAGDDATETPQAAVRSEPTKPRAAEPTPTPSSYRVEYIVTRTVGGPIDIRWTNETEGHENVDEINLGDKTWTKTFQMEPGTFAYVTAQNGPRANANATVTCELKIDGQRIDYTEASGKFASVTCSDTVGH
jgi:hypothetical protein